MMYLPNVAGLNDQAHLATFALADEVVVNSRHCQKRRNRSMIRVNCTIGEDQHFEAVISSVHSIASKAVKSFLK